MAKNWLTRAYFTFPTYLMTPYDRAHKEANARRNGSIHTRITSFYKSLVQTLPLESFTLTPRRSHIFALPESNEKSAPNILFYLF